jgi:class 3 adenylate cyclase
MSPVRDAVDIAAWLQDLGLERYQQAFRDNDVDVDLMSDLSEADLEKLGVASLGHRKILLRAIEALRRARAGLAAGMTAIADETTFAPSPPASGPEAERRQLTVMFVDLVGSTALSAKLDPEDMREVIHAYQNTVAGEIARFEGHVAKFMGDGVLAFFGWPRAHEDEAERAVRASLAIAGAVPTLVTPAGEALKARIGIATGLVVVGDLVGEGAAREESVIGDTPNLAARIQALAEAGGVVVADATRRLVGSLFELKDLGPRRLKGIAAPVHAFAVERERAVEDRFAAHQSGAPLPLVGRDQELALLLHRWRLAKGSEGQAVLLAGEPGIGKSRIVLALRERLRAEPRTSVRYNCSPFHANSALHPVIEQLARAAGFAPEDDAATKLARLEALVAPAAPPDDLLPYLIDLLGLPPDGHALPPLTPQEKKARTFRALLAQLEGLAGQRPVLLVLEDAHWCDPTTLEFFDRVVERVAALRVLLVVTFRPEFRPPWAGHAHVTSLALSRLGRAEAGAIVAEVAGGQALPVELFDAIVGRTDGVPLFVEELTKTVLEGGLLREAEGRLELAGPIPPLAIPATLSDSLLARLDRLAPVKEIAQVGAVIGREFGRALLAAVAGADERGLTDALDRLVAAGLILRRGARAEPLYAFKHALVQDAAYQSLLKSRRQQLHAKVAEALEAGHAGEGDTPPEILAHHLTEGSLFARALPAWLAAAERAWRRSAYRETIAHVRRGLEIAPSVPAPEGTRIAIRLHNLLGAALLAAHGPRPEVIEAYQEAEQLAAEAGETGELLRALWGSWFCHMQRLDVPRVRCITADLLRRAGRASDDGLALQAHHAVWTTEWQTGDLWQAREHAETGVRLYDEAKHHYHTAFYGGHDAGVCSRYTLGITLWLLGFPDQAAHRTEEAEALARRLAHPLTLAMTLTFATWLRLFRGDRGDAWRLTRLGVELCTQQGIPVYLAADRICEGSLRAADGEGGTAADMILSGVRTLETLGVCVRRSFYLGLLAEAHLRAGRPREGLAAVEAALRFVAETGERWYQPELHRLWGELALAAGRARDEARPAFEAARTAARERGARSFELRAAIRLARLDGEAGERQRARDLLAPVYGWFTEGFETPNLIEAKALLDELS